MDRQREIALALSLREADFSWICLRFPSHMNVLRMRVHICELLLMFCP
jgi:hypothetical protein